MGWFSGNYELFDKLVVISGGSQGLGASLAKLCVSKGADVFVVSRTESRLKKVVEDCEKLRIDPDQVIDYIVADLSKQEECVRVFQDIPEVPDIVMCVAGVALPGLLLDVPSQAFESSIDSIYKSSLYFSLEALRRMSKNPLPPKSAPRHITLFSSVVAFYPFIGYGPYAPLKAAVRSLADILRQECIPHNIKVECVFPGNIDTEGFKTEEKTKPEITKIIEGPSDVMHPDDCAELIVNRLDSGYSMIHTDVIGWVLNSITMGGSPRTSSFLITIVGIIVTLAAPIWAMIVDFQIRSFFKKQQKVQPVPVLTETPENLSTTKPTTSSATSVNKDKSTASTTSVAKAESNVQKRNT